jgi:hypothetical protein
MDGKPDYTYDIFISYNHAEREWVRGELLPRLESAGLKVCIDYRDFEIGLPSLINMERAVENNRHTIAILTPDWIASEWCEFECLLTSTTDPSGRKRKLLPLMLKPCQLPTRIKFLTYTDFTKPSEHEERFSSLLRQLRTRFITAAISPFVAGPPITDPRHFFGRERELKRLFNLFKHLPLQNAAIIGPRRSGKTSLLQFLKNATTAELVQSRSDQLSDWRPQPERYRRIFIDFQDTRLQNRDGLLRYLLGCLKLPLPTPCDLDRFLEVVSQNLHAPTIILLDEMDVALRRCPELDNAFWEGLRSLATTQVGGNLAFVLAANESPDQLAQHSGIGSPFFNIFGYTATLGPLTEPEARELISSSPIAFPAADVDWIFAQSGRWPLLLQILCRERLISLEEGETSEIWRNDGLRQIEPFRYLLGVQ